MQNQKPCIPLCLKVFFSIFAGQYEKIVHPMIWRLTIKKLVVMAITGAIMFIFTVLCEYRFFIRKR